MLATSSCSRFPMKSACAPELSERFTDHENVPSRNELTMGEIFMPKMGDAMTEGKVVRWYKQPGDAVKKGEPVLEIETDKVNLDLESEEDGILDQIQVQEGQMAPVGATLATTRGNGAGAAKRPAGEEAKKKPPPEKVEEGEPAA